MNGSYQSGTLAKISLTGALSEATDADGRQYDDFMDAVLGGAEELTQEAKARVSVLEGITRQIRNPR